jgi:uncharacterized membrane protein YphA (DoxX/SURF4 family)
MQTLNKLAPHAGRILLGLVFFVFGLNGFLAFIPQPPHPGASGEFLGALAASGYMFPLIKGTEVIAGLALLSNRFVPLALVVLAPVIVNIVAFHAALDPAGIGFSLVIVVVTLFTAWSYRDAFKGVVAFKARPSVTNEREARQPVHA